ncbi:TetR/AcrR family transcriptional regulator [Leptolinea tardivitalis]|uniref:TetR/AcrR family transcriptional regulator n=1 Tax=Leptolinea tardivitalis TaxID=229920 RepID=UPI0007861C88|nr:TetR/AcrR family transcriptional regulator [Leptolinea tardivitalis]GAP21563.1 transcriptional regulator, TetR family [Leptolinea tardivitalis]
MTVKDAILKTAISLFNELGTARVTTNLIAKEAKISPGNLYYHFNDKAHIIREIYEMMICDWDQVYERVDARPKDLNDSIKYFVRDNFELLWRYRFFNRETIALINADCQLYARHTEMTHMRLTRQRKIIQEAIQIGLFKPTTTEKEMDDLLTIAWIVSNHYLLYLEGMGQCVQKSDFDHGVDLVMQVLKPYRNDDRKNE